MSWRCRGLAQDTQGRINHCAGCTMGGSPPPPPGAPDQQLPNFYHAVLTFERIYLFILKSISYTKYTCKNRKYKIKKEKVQNRNHKTKRSGTTS